MKAMTTDVTARELIDKLLNNIPALMEKHNVPGLSLLEKYDHAYCPTKH
jgi:hypothetical protein